MTAQSTHPLRRLRSRVTNHPVVKAHVLDRYRKVTIRRDIPGPPFEAATSVDEAQDVLLMCSGYLTRFHLQTYVQELAFAHELAAHGRRFAMTDDPSVLFEKNVAWFLPGAFVAPRLWDYSRQVYEFALGLESQGNRAFCSSEEARYWENKAHMHRMLEAAGVATPRTVLIDRENRDHVAFDIEPVLVKQEHSAGSAGLHHFDTAEEAREFVAAYPLRPAETLVMQELVRGATRDMRLTMAGSNAIEGATYWRIKSPEALASPTWTPTATKYNSRVVHGEIPDAAVARVADYLKRLNVRTAGVDLMWVDDDVSKDPVVLEFSPYYQPNPPKPTRYDHWTYKQYKQRSYAKDGYLAGQYRVFRAIAAALLDQELV